MYFIYGEAELAYLRRKDKRLAAVIDRIGPVERTVDPDLFSAVVHHIIGQQISMKAQATIWQRMQDTLGSVSAETILAAGVPALQALGMTFRKAEYLTDLAGRIVDGSFNLEAVRSMDDAEAIRALSSLRGIGVWTAEMILLFCLQRPDIFSYDDLAIRRADARSQRGADGAASLKVDADRAAVHGAAHEASGVAAVEGRTSGHIGLAVRPGPDRGFLCTGLTEQRARQMVGADAAGAVIGSAELLPAGAALRLCCGFPPGKLRCGDGPDVKNGAAHSLTTTGPSGGRRHIPAER